MVLSVMAQSISVDKKNTERRHSLKLMDKVPEELKCPLCEKLLREPIQTVRGELACEDCYVEKKRLVHKSLVECQFS